MTARYASLIHRNFSWMHWEALIRVQGVTLDRPSGTHHPAFPEIVYPIDYGFVRGTASSDGAEVDLFVGTAKNGLVGLIVTRDFRRRDREMKLLWQCTPREIYLAHGFINFDRHKMEGTLVMRYPMHSLWAD